MDETTDAMPTINSFYDEETQQEFAIEDTVARTKAEAALENGVDVDTLRDLVYPVGAIYQSFDPTSPASFLGGEWEQLENVFLRAGSNTETGGSDSRTLVNGNIGRFVMWSPPGVPGWGTYSGNTLYFSGSNSGIQQRVIGSESQTPVSTVPYYQSVYTWKRTA